MQAPSEPATRGHQPQLAPALPQSTEVARVMQLARTAQQEWRQKTIAERLLWLPAARRVLFSQADALTQSFGGTSRDIATSIAAEMIPLLDAMNFLEQRAAAILSPRRESRVGGAAFQPPKVEVTQEPFGVVLVLGPANYPLFLPGVQALQALVAGNAVVWKPGAGGRLVAQAFANLLLQAGLPAGLLHVLDDSIATGVAALAAQPDFVALTGSTSSGRNVLATLADRATPAAVELSGCDAVFVLPGADHDRLARALVFALRLNHGATCFAPRRVFLTDHDAELLIPRLDHWTSTVEPLRVSPAASLAARQRVQAAIDDGARAICGCLPQDDIWPILVLDGVTPHMELVCSDVFAPVTSLLRTKTIEQALVDHAVCPYRLSASVFGPAAAARELALRLDVGCVLINDLVVSAADPRVPFAGRGASGFGAARGMEGLLEFTQPKAIVTPNSRWAPQLDAPGESPSAESMRALLQWTHGPTWWQRMQGLWRLIREGRRPKS